MSARVVITIALRVRAFRMEFCSLSGAASARRQLMPARETEAIILKTFPLGEADRLVSFLGRSSGRVRGVASGARRLLILPEHEVSEPMFRLVLLAAREVERTGDWNLALSYFAFWTVRLGGWLPRFDRCVSCGSPFESKPAFYDGHQAGLFCENCRRSGMKPMHIEARNLAERFAGERLDRIEYEKSLQPSAKELREAGLAWIEHHIERRLMTRELLETT